MNNEAFRDWFGPDDLSYVVDRGTATLDGSVELTKSRLNIVDGTSIGFTTIRPKAHRWNGSTIIWGHWLGPQKSNRVQYHDEALLLAELGFASMLFDAPWSSPDWYGKRNLDTEASDFRLIFRSFYALFDYAHKHERAESKNLYYIGHDYSAMFAIPVLSLFKPMRGSCLICFTYSFYDWGFYMQNPSDWHRYHADNDIYELSAFFDEFGPNTLCQFAIGDHYVNEARRRAISQRFEKQGSEVRAYEGLDGDAHELDSDLARQDRKKWLLSLEKAGATD